MATIRTSVLISGEAAERLKRFVFPLYLSGDESSYYFNCDTIDATGPMLTMKIPRADGRKGPSIEIQIHYTDVVMTLRASAKNPLGFVRED
jgi:hypothetical protein